MSRSGPVSFDTHRFVKRMTEAGMPAAQAEALAEEQVVQLDAHLLTKQDVAELTARLDQFATKEDVQATREDVAAVAARQDQFATKEDVAAIAARLDQFATKEEVAAIAARLDGVATKEDVAAVAAAQTNFATRDELAEVRTELAIVKTKVGVMLWLVSSIGGGVVFLVFRSIWPF